MVRTFPNAPLAMPPTATSTTELAACRGKNTPPDVQRASTVGTAIEAFLRNIQEGVQLVRGWRQTILVAPFKCVLWVAHEILSAPWYRSYIILFMQIGSLWPLASFLQGEGWAVAAYYSMVCATIVGSICLIRCLIGATKMLTDFFRRVRSRKKIASSDVWGHMTDGEGAAFSLLVIFPTFLGCFASWKVATGVALIGTLSIGFLVIAKRYIVAWFNSIPKPKSKLGARGHHSELLQYIFCDESAPWFGWAILLGIAGGLCGQTWGAGLSSLVLLPYFLFVGINGLTLFVNEVKAKRT